MVSAAGNLWSRERARQTWGIDEVLWKGGQDKLLSIGIEFLDPARPARRFDYSIEMVSGVAGYVNIQTEQLILREGDKQYELIARDKEGRWLVNANSERLVSIQAERSAMELAPPNWDGYPLKWFAQNWRHYQFVPALMNQVNQVTMGGVLQPHGENLSAWLMWLQTRSPESFERITEVARDVSGDSSSLDLAHPAGDSLPHISGAGVTSPHSGPPNV